MRLVEWCLKNSVFFSMALMLSRCSKDTYLYNLPLFLPSYLAIISTKKIHQTKPPVVPFRNHGDNDGEEDEDAEITRCAS